MIRLAIHGHKLERLTWSFLRIQWISLALDIVEPLDVVLLTCTVDLIYT